MSRPTAFACGHCDKSAATDCAAPRACCLSSVRPTQRHARARLPSSAMLMQKSISADASNVTQSWPLSSTDLSGMRLSSSSTKATARTSENGEHQHTNTRARVRSHVATAGGVLTTAVATRGAHMGQHTLQRVHGAEHKRRKERRSEPAMEQRYEPRITLARAILAQVRAARAAGERLHSATTHTSGTCS